MKPVIEAVPVALISAFYVYIQWYLLVQVGFGRMNAVGQVMALSFFPAYVGAAWYLLGNPSGKWHNLSVGLLIVIPILYIIAVLISNILGLL